MKIQCNKHVFRGAIALIGPLWISLFVGLLSVTMPVMAVEPIPIYRVQAVEITVPLPVKSGRNPRTIGLSIAKKVAFNRLFMRMLTQSDRKLNREFLNTLRKQNDRFVERVVVQSEKRRARSIVLTIEVTFSQKELGSAFGKMALNYTETQHPDVLIMVEEKDLVSEQWVEEDSFLNALLASAEEFGLQIVTPLGDMEDMKYLTWERAVKGDLLLRQWAFERYQAGGVWAIAVTLDRIKNPQDLGPNVPSKETKVTKTSGYFSTAQLFSEVVDETGEVPLGEQVKIKGACAEDVRRCFYPQLAQILLQRRMDRWILAHTINPSLAHTVRLRVVHGPIVSDFARFLSGLELVSGLTNVRFLQARAMEATLEVNFQGRDEQLHQAVSKLGAVVEVGDNETVLHLP